MNNSLIYDWLKRNLELSRGGQGCNVRPMEGMRGLAVFMVFLVHFSTAIEPLIYDSGNFLIFVKSVHLIGNSGVDLFFVLSGYLIYGSLMYRPIRFYNFLYRRIKRIYPAFIIVFVLYVALSYIFPDQSKIPKYSTECLVYLIQNFLLMPGLFPIVPMITVSWSLSYEIFYYLSIPLIITAFNLRDCPPIWRVIFFIVIVVVFFIYCSVWGGHIRLAMFISGIFVYEIVNFKEVPCPNGMFSAIAFVGGLLSMLLPIDGEQGSALKIVFLFIGFFIFCFSCFRNPQGWLPQLLSWTPIRWLGNISYSYYLIHGLAINGIFLIFGKINVDIEYWAFIIMLPFVFCITLIPSLLLFVFFERKFSITVT